MVFQILASYRYNKEFFLCEKNVAIDACRIAQNVINTRQNQSPRATKLTKEELDRIVDIWSQSLLEVDDSDIDID